MILYNVISCSVLYILIGWLLSIEYIGMMTVQGSTKYLDVSTQITAIALSWLMPLIWLAGAVVYIDKWLWLLIKKGAQRWLG